MRRLASILLTALLIISWDANAIAASNESSFEENIQRLADFFLPPDSLASLLKDGCQTAYRTKLQRTPSDTDLERAMPGIHDQMVSAAGAYCDAAALPALLQQQAKIKADWRTTISPSELQRFVDFFQDDIAVAQNRRVDVREGEMVGDAIDRTARLSTAEAAAYSKRQQAFAKTPGGRQLLTRISRYQTKLNEDSGDWIGPVMRAALSRAHVAANEYARKKGFSDPYPGE